MSISTRVLSLALAGIVLLPAASAAQTASTVTFGVKAGVNSSDIKFDNSTSQGTKRLLGAVGGLFLVKQITDNVGVQVEGLFSQKGAKDAAPGSDAQYRLTYVDVPVLLRFGPTTTNETHFHVFTGPQVSFKTKAEGTENGRTFDLDSETENTDFGWVLGASVERSRFSLDARYALGLKDISIGSETAKNRVFSLMMGVKLR